MPDEPHCSRCDEPINLNHAVTVPGLTGAGQAHQECVPDEYRDFMQLIRQTFPAPQADLTHSAQLRGSDHEPDRGRGSCGLDL